MKIKNKKVISLVLAVVVLGIGAVFLFGQNNSTTATKVSKVSRPNVCSLITKEEIRSLLGENEVIKPIASEPYIERGVSSSVCEYNQAKDKTIILHVADANNPQAFKELVARESQPFDVEEDYGIVDEQHMFNNFSGFVRKEYIGREGLVLGSARFITDSGSVQLNAHSLEVAKKAADIVAARFQM